MLRRACFVLVCAAALASVTAEAGLWQDAFQGLDLLATPLGSPVFTTSDGTRVNGARSGRVRIVPNGVLGDGYRLEFDRSFGLDSRGRPETLNFGGLGSLTLSGATQFTAGYNNFGGKFLSGTANLGVNNLQYSLRTTNGAEDIALSGTLNVGANLDINQLGFYTLNLNASNTNSTATVNGIATDRTEPTNFDVGPISIQGNIFADAGVSLLAALGVDTSGYSQLFPKSPADQITAAIENSVQGLNASTVAGATEERSIAPLLLQAVLGGDQNAAAELTQGLVDGTLRGEAASLTTPAVPLPEPGTLLLMALGTVPYWRKLVRAAQPQK